MGLLFACLFVVGVIVVVRSLRLRGCFGFVVWMLIGMGIVWLGYQFLSGALRV